MDNSNVAFLYKFRTILKLRNFNLCVDMYKLAMLYYIYKGVIESITPREVTRNSDKERCPREICNMKRNKNTRWVQCDICDHWLHQSIQNEGIE